MAGEETAAAGSSDGTAGFETLPGGAEILGESSGSGEIQPTVTPPEKSSTGIARPSWMTTQGGTVATESKTASSESTAPAKENTTAPAATPAASVPPVVKEGVEAGTTPEGEPGVKETPPPAGFVPKAALSEARGEAKYFREQLTARESRIAELEAQVAAKAVVPAPGQFDGFKVLSDEDLEELADEDPVAAAKYAKDLVKFERFQADKQANDAKMAERTKELGISVNVAKARIQEIMPDDAMIDRLSRFALESGMSQDVFDLTNPETQAVINGELRPLGNLAANLVEVIASFMDKATTQQVITIDTVPQNIKDEIIRGAQEAIVNKVKTPSQTRTVSNIPSVNRSADGRFAGKSYGDLKTKEERDAYLRGDG